MTHSVQSENNMAEGFLNILKFRLFCPDKVGNYSGLVDY